MPTTTLDELRQIASQLASAPENASDPPTEEATLSAHARTQLQSQLAVAYLEETEGRIDRLTKRIDEWRRGKGFVSSWYNVPEKLMLTVSELAEAMEAYRHLPRRILDWLSTGSGDPPEPGEWCVWETNLEEELADTFIRLTDLCGALQIDLAAAVCRKMAVNELRPHKHGKEC